MSGQKRKPNQLVATFQLETAITVIITWLNLGLLKTVLVLFQTFYCLDWLYTNSKNMFWYGIRYRTTKYTLNLPDKENEILTKYLMNYTCYFLIWHFPIEVSFIRTCTYYDTFYGCGFQLIWGCSNVGICSYLKQVEYIYD
jgi:hypothetical protein